MKKIYLKLLLGALLIPTPLIAQETPDTQLPNAGFENNWVDCIPWNCTNSTKAQGVTPSPWTISHTYGAGGTGKTTVGSKVTGYGNTGYAAQITNKKITVYIFTKTIPGYITLGTPWATSSGSGSNMDGGSWGGYQFIQKPDALSFMYMKSGYNSSKSAKTRSTVIAYLWNGEYNQANVPAEISMGTPSKTTLVDRDRNILGMSTPQGGAVTKEGKRIAKINHYFEGNTEKDTWANMTLPFEYEEENLSETPEKINVIFSAGDYFDSAPESGATLTIDDVKLLYYSRLKSIEFNGTPVAIEEGKYDYNVTLYSANDVDFNNIISAYELFGQSAVAKTSVNGNVVTVKVSNVDADKDGLKEHTYNFTVKVVKPSGEAEVNSGYLTINLGGGDISGNAEAKVNITPYEDGTYQFVLPDFKLSLGDGDPMPLGDIVVNALTKTTIDGVDSYNGEVIGMKLNGGIDANVVIEGTIDANKVCDFVINVNWVMDADNIIPIPVTFKSTPEIPHYTENVEIDGVNYIEIGTPGATHLEYWAKFVAAAQPAAVRAFATDENDGYVKVEANAEGRYLYAVPTDAKGTLYVKTRGVANGRESKPIEFWLEKGTSTGLLETMDDTAAPAEYYTLQGVRVAAPAPGAVYIVRQGSTAKKIRF